MTTINVTQQHIDEGCAQKADSCPIALAVTEVLREPYYGAFSRWSGGIGEKGRSDFWHRYSWDRGTSPTEAFIDAYDAGKPVQPFSFDLDIPAEFLK